MDNSIDRENKNLRGTVKAHADAFNIDYHSLESRMHKSQLKMDEVISLSVNDDKLGIY